MIKHNQLHLPDRHRTKNVALATLASLGIAATSANAQPTTGGTEAAPVVTHEGGIQADPTETDPNALTPAEQKLQTQVQKDANRLAKRALHASPKQHKSKPELLLDTDGNTIAHLTVNVNSRTKGGGYQFDIWAPVGDDGRTPQLDRVDAVSIGQTVTNKAGDLTTSDMVTIGTNPRSKYKEISGLYMFDAGKKSGTQTMFAEIHPAAGDGNPELTDRERLAAVYQADYMLDQARHGGPVTPLMPAFNQQGETVLDPAN
jgi:hypothetical protein